MSDPDRVVWSEWFGGARMSTVYKVATAVHTSSLDVQIRPVCRHLPKPCPDVGNSEPIPVLRTPEDLVHDQRVHQHRIRVLCTARPRVVLQV